MASKLRWYLAGGLVAFIALGVGLTSLRGGLVSTSVQPTSSAPPAFLAGTPAAALATYLQGDFEGERLERASWGKYRERVLWPAEPAFASAYVIRGYRIATGPTTEVKAQAECTFDTLGELDLESFVYTPSPSRQTVPYTLEREGDAWRIGLPMLRPHVGVEGAIAYLHRMAGGYPKLKTAIATSIARIQSDAQASPAP